MNEYGLVVMTASSREEAETIARSLVEKRLAACAQVVSDIRSFYWWEGKLCDDSEVLFFAKTTRSLFAELQLEVTQLHSYDVPQIVFVPIDEGLPAYLQWIADETTRK